MSDAVSAPQKELLNETGGTTSAKERENAQAASELNKESGSKLSMHVKVHSPFKNYFEGDAFSLSAENLTGPFDILPSHHNFISLLSPCELIVRSSKGEQRIRISGGLMHVKANAVIVFLDV